ncbi:hypothetical protein [Flavobacterium tegetincola]|uniref:hypothetical protein n=1 Tax=Flavobacterium tegetincola TaxID=150172 RepID=UPI000426AAB0|nr:hypothetical protein [Flavobacterium tegetincola]
MKKQVINYETKLWACYEIKNPFEVLDAFIDHARTDYYKQIVSQAVLHAEKQEVYNKDYPSQLFICHAALRSFLRACSRLHHKSKKWQVKQTTSDCKSVLHQASLTKEEYNNPFKVFQNAFTKNSIHELENKLAEIVFLAVLPQQVDYITDLSTAYIHIVKLLDAAQLIRERGLEKRKKETTSFEVLQQEYNAPKEQEISTLTLENSSEEDKMKQEPQEENPTIEEEQYNNQNQITTLITAKVATYGIYCFEQRTIKECSTRLQSKAKQSNSTHYYLLVIVPTLPQNATADLAYLIKIQTRGRCTVTLLIHTVRDLRRDKTNQGYFFQQLVFEGVTWFEDWSNTTPLNLADATKSQFKHLEKYWRNRKIILEGLMDAAEAIDQDGSDILKINFLHQALEQLCLGLIHTFLGYRPHHFALGYLLDLCDLFTPIASQFFPRKTKQELNVVEPLFRSIHDVRYLKSLGKRTSQLPTIQQRYLAFYEHASRAVDLELLRLQEVN